MSIEVREIHKAYNGTTALHQVDLTVATGEFVSVLGPSGCGKTTLLRCLAGLATPDSGTITLNGVTCFDNSRGINVPARRRHIGMVFQDFALWPHLSVFDNIAFPLRARGNTEGLEEAVNEAMSVVQLQKFAQRRPTELSGGQQQRVAFARAIVARPQVLLMDEPLSALDAHLRQELRAELSTITREIGVTTLYITHDQEEALAMSDRIVVMREGRVVQLGDPETLYRNPSCTFVATFVGHFNALPQPGAGLRPEDVRVGPSPHEANNIPATVESCMYTIGRFQLRCRTSHSESPWVLYSPTAVPHGTQISVHFHERDVINLHAGVH